MKILYIHQHFTTPRGSDGTRSYEFARALLAAGHQVTMVCGANENSGLNLKFDPAKGYLYGSVEGIEVIGLGLPYSNRQGIARRAISFLRFGWRSILIALRRDYDLIFATSTPLTAALPGIAAKLLRRKRFIFEVRDLWPELPRALGMRNPLLLGGMSLLEWTAYWTCDQAIGLSPGIVEGIRRRSPKLLPVTLVPNGCDLELFHPRHRGPITLAGLGAEHFIAAFTGAHGPANGLRAVLAAAAVLKRRNRDQIKLVFIGDGKEKDALKSQAQTAQLDNCLFFPPMPKEQLAQVIAGIDCGLMILKNVPAFYYGTSPNKFFDYIAAGLPVLINYPGWLAELIRAERCGVVVPADDPEAFADALETLARDSELRRGMGHAARHLAEAQFAREKLAQKFVAVLESAAPPNARCPKSANAPGVAASAHRNLSRPSRH